MTSSYHDAFASRRGPPPDEPIDTVTADLDALIRHAEDCAAGSSGEWGRYYTERAALLRIARASVVTAR